MHLYFLYNIVSVKSDVHKKIVQVQDIQYNLRFLFSFLENCVGGIEK